MEKGELLNCMIPLHPGCGDDVGVGVGDNINTIVIITIFKVNTMVMITLVFTLKMMMVIMTGMTVILHLAMEEEEFKEGRTVMVVITGGVKVNIPTPSSSPLLELV